MSIFDDIASGADRLRRGEDALIWNLRAAGMDWHEVGTVLLTRRAERRERCLAMIATRRPAIRTARVDRERLRQERARA